MKPINNQIHHAIGEGMDCYITYIQDGDDFASLIPMRMTYKLLNDVLHHKVLRRMQRERHIIDWGPRPLIARMRFNIRQEYETS